MRHEPDRRGERYGSFELRERNHIGSIGRAGPSVPSKAAIRSLFNSLEQKGVRYCHWKSNIRLEETLAAAEDIDLLVDQRDAELFHTALLENGFKLAQSRSGIGHPGVFHALGLDEASAELVHVHAYFQIVSGDSLVKSYRLPIERSLLEQTRYLHGVRVPDARSGARAIRAPDRAQAHRPDRDPDGQSPLSKGSRGSCAGSARQQMRSTLRRFARLGSRVSTHRCFGSCWTPSRPSARLIRRVVLGWRVAWRLRGLRRLSPMIGAVSRLWRVLSLLVKRLRRRRELVLQTGGMIVALVGPKATGKSTISHELATRLGLHLDVLRIHAGKPPATALTLLPRLLVPAARLLFSKERAGEYEKPERRREKRYSLLYILRMTLLAYDRRKLLAGRCELRLPALSSSRTGIPRKAWVPSTAAALTKRRWQNAALR